MRSNFIYHCFLRLYSNHCTELQKSGANRRKSCASGYRYVLDSLQYFLFPTACLGSKVFFSLSISDLTAASLVIVGDLNEARTCEFSVLVPHYLVHDICLLSAHLY